MKIVATNIGKPTKVEWNGKTITTGIYKYPVDEPILLQKEEVANDTVVDRENHGGIYKACYLFNANNYAFWKKQYPNLNWDWGMFGENLTVTNLDESIIRIGDIYRIGHALVQVTQPREPCYKLGIRFKNQSILKKFIEHQKPGMYARVIEDGEVTKGDGVQLVKRSNNKLTIKGFYKLLYMKSKDKKIVQLAITNEALPKYKKESVKKWS